MKKQLFIAGMLFLLVAQSCSSNDELSSQNDQQKKEMDNRLTSDSKTLSGYIKNQLTISTKIKDLLDQEKGADFSMIQTGLEKVKTVDDLKMLYKNANVKNIDQLITLYQELNSNTQTFVGNNPDFYSKYKEEERLSLLTNEIDSQLDASNIFGTARANCQGNFATASKRCMRNYLMSMTVAVVGGTISFGAGAIIAGAAATAVMIACNSDAESDYHTCMNGRNS